MPVSIKGTGGGSVTLTAGAAAADTTLTIPNVTGTVLQSGTAVTVAQGGTGLATLTAANNALYSTSSSAMTAGTLPAAAGGTGLTAPGTSGNVLTSNGTAWTSATPASTGITSGTAVSASGTSVDFTGIPSTAKRVTVIFSGLSTNGTSNPLIQIGSVSIQSTGYNGYSTNISSGTISSTAGFPIYSAAAVNILIGFLVLDLIGSNKWVIAGNYTLNQSGTIYAMLNSGDVILSGALDRVRVTTAGGTDTFDAGTLNIFYE